MCLNLWMYLERGTKKGVGLTEEQKLKGGGKGLETIKSKEPRNSRNPGCEHGLCGEFESIPQNEALEKQKLLSNQSP